LVFQWLIGSAFPGQLDVEWGVRRLMVCRIVTEILSGMAAADCSIAAAPGIAGP
jgi:hypothetical protein